MKKTLIIGATPNKSRYAYMAAERLHRINAELVLLGTKTGEIFDKEILHSTEGITDIDTVTLYINPSIQASYREFLLELKPKRVIFNPGTENPALARELSDIGVETLEACTLVMIGTGQY